MCCLLRASKSHLKRKQNSQTIFSDERNVVSFCFLRLRNSAKFQFQFKFCNRNIVWPEPNKLKKSEKKNKIRRRQTTRINYGGEYLQRISLKTNIKLQVTTSCRRTDSSGSPPIRLFLLSFEIHFQVCAPTTLYSFHHFYVHFLSNGSPFVVTFVVVAVAVVVGYSGLDILFD